MMLRIIQLCLLIVILNVYCLTAQSVLSKDIGSCKDPENRNGECVLIYDCPALRGYMDPEEHKKPEVMKLILSHFCGLSGWAPKVCCASPSPMDWPKFKET